MFVLNLVFLALLSSSVLSGIPRYVQGQWVISEDNVLYDDANPQSLPEESVWPDSPSAAGEEMILLQEQNLLTTPQQYVLEEQESNEVGDSVVWKIGLVASVLLVSVVGSLSVAYYMCIWRGGRIHYQPQKQSCT